VLVLHGEDVPVGVLRDDLLLRARLDRRCIAAGRLRPKNSLVYGDALVSPIGTLVDLRAILRLD